ncbi:MAG: hypothetical protein ABWY46_16690 [Pseudomonas sp.]
MTTPESIDDGVLALSPPRVLLVTQPVVGAHVGLSLASSDLIPDGEGATVEVDPPLSGTVDPGDVIWLWLLGETAFLDSKIITDVNAKTILRIPKGRLHPDRINELFYTITRNSSNIGKSEPNLTLLYNKIRPGLKDRFPEIDGHSELALLLPDAIKQGVGPDFVSAQVCVSYPYCRAYDTITLKCNGEIMTYKVGADEAPQPPNPGSADPITVCFTVTRAYLDSAVRPDGKLDFSCTCTDQIGNTPDTDAVWSATQRVDEDLAGTLLSAALLREQLNDPGDDLNFIDLKKLRGNPLLLIILTADSRFQLGYTLEALYTATSSGQPDVVVRVSGTVEADEFGQKKICVLEVPNDKVPAGYRVAVTHELFNGTTWVGRSKTATALVVGESTIEIDAPTLVPPATIPVDPLDHAQGVRVRVDFVEAQPGDKAQLKLVNPLPGSPEFLELSLDQTFAIFTLDVVFLGLWYGKAPQLRWDLIRGGEVIAQSLALVVTVLPISNGDERLLTPKILQAANDGDGPELDVSNLTAGATVKCLVWPLIAFGQPVWLHLRGKNASGGEHNITLLRHPNNAVHYAWLNAGYYNAPVLYSYLKDLGDGSVLEVWFTAALDKGTDESKAVRFPVRRYTVQAALMTPPAPKIKEASSNTLDPIAAKDHLTVVVPQYPDMRSTDKISVIWSGTVGNGSYTSEDFEVGTVGIKEIPIPNTVVVFNLGLPVTVSYIVIRDGVSTPSLTLQLTVGTIKNEDDRLPIPTLAGNTGPGLDVLQLTTKDLFELKQWPLQALRQVVWLRYDGLLDNGTAAELVIWGGLPHNYPPSDLATPLTAALIAWLKNLKDGSKVTVTFEVNFDKVRNAVTKVTFPLRVYTVSTAPELVVDITDLTISGANVSLEGSGLEGLWKLSGKDPVGTWASRLASGGVRPYIYKSSNELIASVDDNGVVRSVGNGTATITVTDDALQTKSFQVHTSGVKYLRYRSTPGLYAHYQSWAQSVGGYPITNSPTFWPPIVHAIDRKYINTLPGNSGYLCVFGSYSRPWSGTIAGLGFDVVLGNWHGGGGPEFDTLPYLCLLDRP